MLKVACIQIDCIPGDVQKNLEKAQTFIRMAKGQGADLVVLPELCNVGYDLNVVKSMDYGAQGFADTKAHLAALAREFQVHIAAGVVEVEPALATQPQLTLEKQTSLEAQATLETHVQQEVPTMQEAHTVQEAPTMQEAHTVQKAPTMQEVKTIQVAEVNWPSSGNGLDWCTVGHVDIEHTLLEKAENPNFNSSEDRLYNSLLVFDPQGEVIATYRKVCLFPLSFEETLFIPGERAVTVNIHGMTLGLMICFDIRFPELSRQYFTEDCVGIVVASAFPFPRLDHWRTLLKSRAIENQMYIMAANRVGQDAGLQFLGNSCIIDPWGTVKATADELEEAIIIHEIDPGKLSEVRGRIACRESYQRLQGGIVHGKR